MSGAPNPLRDALRNADPKTLASIDRALADARQHDAERLRRFDPGACGWIVGRNPASFARVMYADALLEAAERLAADVGRIRRRFASNEGAWSVAWLADRLAEQVESLDCMLSASAGELVREGDEVDDALRSVGRRQALIRRLLGTTGPSAAPYEKSKLLREGEA